MDDFRQHFLSFKGFFATFQNSGVACAEARLKVSSLRWKQIGEKRPEDQPDLIARAVMLTMTSGLASKMTKSTPIGQVTLFSSKPSSNFLA